MATVRRFIRLTIVVVAVAATMAAHAAKPPAPPEPPPGLGRYVVSLWEAGTPDPRAGGRKLIERGPEPDIVTMGGQVLRSNVNRRLVNLPPAAVEQLRRHPAVMYVQRIWTGEPLDEWVDPPPSSSTRSVIATDDTNLTWEREYAYDDSGNITAAGTDSYTYDSAGRLIRATVNSKVETYKYDEFGNLVEKAVVGSSAGESPNVVHIPVDPASNRLIGPEYDVAGNMTTRSDRRKYTYDSLNMISHNIDPIGGTRRILYDASDERIGTLYGNGSRWTIRDFDGQVIREYNGDAMLGIWIWKQDHVVSEGGLIAGQLWEYTQAYGYNGAKKRHYHRDHLGTVRLVTGDDGRTIREDDYYPFGIAQTKSFQEDEAADYHVDGMRFAGHWRDYLGDFRTEDRDYLDYMHARYYDPQVGRFLSVDPVFGTPNMPQSWNRYSYAFNNPARFSDPAGRYPCPTVGSDGVERIGECHDVEGKQPEVDGTTVSLLAGWLAGRISAKEELTASNEDAEDLAGTPAWQNVKDQLIAKNCAPGVYYPEEFGPREFFTTFSLTGHLVGGFGASVVPLNDGRIAVNAQNVWGRASLTRWPLSDRRAPALQDLGGWLTSAARGPTGPVSPLPPSSTLHDVATGYLANVTVNYYWTEASPCQN